MGGFLKQSTAAVIPFGPFLDKTDGVTLEVAAGIITSIDHATTGIFLSKNGGTGTIRHQGVTASVLDAYGMFLVTLDTTDTNTCGHLRVMMAEAATFLPVWDDFTVLPANVFDSLMGTDLLDTNAAQWLGTAILAPGVAGTPDVNAKLIGGTAQTGNDNGADINAILVDTNELQTDWVNGGRLDLLLDGAASAGDPWVTAIPGAYAAGSAGKKMSDLYQALTGKWEVVNNQFIIYDSDGTTALFTYDMTQDGVGTEWNPDKRSPV